MFILRVRIGGPETDKVMKTGKESSMSRKRRMWWLLPLLVLFVLVGVIYVLGHISSTDSEMYPTTKRRVVSALWLC
jgi:hypothetical protein